MDSNNNKHNSHPEIGTDPIHESEIKNKKFPTTSSSTKVVNFQMDKLTLYDSASRGSAILVPSTEVLKYNYDTSNSLSRQVTNRSFSADDKMYNGSNYSKQNYLENIKEVDEEQENNSINEENKLNSREASLRDNTSDIIPKCIPPWAKSMRKNYGIPSNSSLEENDEELKPNMREKLEELMKKHSDLMLVKRVESKKQLVLEPSKCFGDLEAVRMRAKNTRYYMAPLSKTKERISKEVERESQLESIYEQKTSFGEADNDSMSITKKTSRTQARREAAEVLKSFYKSGFKKQSEVEDLKSDKIKKDQTKCPKITLSKIREYVNAQSMDPEDRRLCDIIKVERVPSLSEQDKGRSGSKYIINVPRTEATMNIIKIKEKRKLKDHSFENVDEITTELHYSHRDGSRRKEKERTHLHLDVTKPEEKIKKKVKSPTETKTFELTAIKTPRVAPLIDEETPKTDKLLLIQYEKKKKTPGSPEVTDNKLSTRLLGIREPYNKGLEEGEMYLYGSEKYGTRIRENVAKIDEIPPTLKDKVNLIFQELREMTLKTEAPPELASSEVQVCPEVTSKTTQRSSLIRATEVATVQAVPDVRSAEIQVRESQFSMKEPFMMVPHPSPASQYKYETKTDQSIDHVLKEKFKDLVDTGATEEIKSLESNQSEHVKKHSLELEEEMFKEKDDELSGQVIKDTDEEVRLSHDALQEREIMDVEVKGEDILLEDSQLETQLETELSKEIPAQEEIVESKEDDVISVEDAKKTDGDVHEERQLEIETQETETSVEELPEKSLELEDEFPTTPSEILRKEEARESIEEEKELEDAGSIEDGEIRESKRVSTVSFTLKDNKLTFLDKLKNEDIRSYDFDPLQETELKIKSSSKFLYKKESIRKRMNWTNDTVFLEKHTCPQLIRALAETAMRRPPNPISFLAHRIYKEYHNQETEEKAQIFHEHLSLARVMREIDQQQTQERKTFNVVKYPVAKLPATPSEQQSTSEEIPQEA